MTERKPAGERWESWIERQIREARERGDFDDLPGAGKPIPDAGRPGDAAWWLRARLRREGISLLPPALEIRREVERRLRRAMELETEEEVRREVEEINGRIRRVNATLIAGPASSLAPVDVESVLERWRERT